MLFIKCLLILGLYFVASCHAVLDQHLFFSLFVKINKIDRSNIEVLDEVEPLLMDMRTECSPEQKKALQFALIHVHGKLEALQVKSSFMKLWLVECGQRMGPFFTAVPVIFARAHITPSHSIIFGDDSYRFNWHFVSDGIKILSLSAFLWGIGKGSYATWSQDAVQQKVKAYLDRIDKVIRAYDTQSLWESLRSD